MPPETADPETIISAAESERATVAQDAADAYQWFADHIGQMVSRAEAIDAIADHLGCEPGHASRVVANLINDAVDPVQQIRANGTKWVGIIDYREYPDSGAYGYVNYDDTTGKHRRLVCAKCVDEAETPSDVSTATAGTGSLPDDASYDQLLNRVTSHYASNHDAAPEDIEIGASLISGTTIDSNKAFHAGNDGLNSGLDADTVQGTDVTTEIDNHKSASQDVHGVGSNNAVASDQDITDHTSNDVHDQNQPPQSHDNGAHSSTFAIEGTTAVEDFVSNGNGGDTFVVNADGTVTAEPPSADTDVHGFGGGKHDPSALADINPKISDGQIQTGVDSLVTASDSPYLASGDNLVLVDTSTGTVTVQLASADTTQGNKVRVVDIAGQASTNNITVETESTETIDPGGASTATISVDGAWLDLYPDGSDWYAQDNIEADTADVSDIQATTATVSDTFTDPGGVSHTVELFEAADYTPVTDVDAKIDNAATSVAALDDAVAGKSEDTHDHSGETITPATLEATDTITDASGTDHTGEIADSDQKIESFQTGGSDGTVPTAQGDGSVKMESITTGTIPQDTAPSNTDVIWLDTSKTPPKSKVYDSNTSAWIPVNTVGTIVSKTKPNVRTGVIWFKPVSDGIEMYYPGVSGWSLIDVVGSLPSGVASIPGTSGSGSATAEQQATVKTKAAWPSLRCKSFHSGVSKAYLRDSGGTLLKEIDIPGTSYGDIFEFTGVWLNAGTEYIIGVDDDGGSFTKYYNTNLSYPYTSTNIDLLSQSGSKPSVLEVGNV